MNNMFYQGSGIATCLLFQISKSPLTSNPPLSYYTFFMAILADCNINLFYSGFSLQGVFVFSFIGYSDLTYQGYTYPWWGYVIGWFFALSSMVTIPLYFLYAFMAAEGGLADVSTFRRTI